MLPLIAPGLAIAFALVFVMSFAVFPSAMMLGQPSGSDANDFDRRLSAGL